MDAKDLAAAPPQAAPSLFPSAAPALPATGAYLQEAFRLGVRSLMPALPALVLLYFYRFGMGLYLVFSGTTTSPLGFPDYQAQAVTMIVTMAAYLPLLVLVFTPFLPLQDGILHGRPRSFFDCVKYVLEILSPYAVSAVLQFLIIALPAMAIVIGISLATIPFGAMTIQLRTAFILLGMFPAVCWIGFSMFFLSFATPLLVLDHRGPVASLGESARLVRRHFGGLSVRLSAFTILLVLAMIFLSLPSAMLTVASAASGSKVIAIDVARLVWESGVSALLFPFWVAGLLVLYRAVVPAAAAAEPIPATPAPAPENVSTTPPYRFE
jgi:hypothetical protein